MPRLHLNVSEETARALEWRSRAAGKSLSAYLAKLVRDNVGNDWPPGFFENVLGKLEGQTFAALCSAV